ncbi:hypothetical protein [Sediminicurvatus halobius]|uniref:hypothetical protein n=1 Tax=Sediminicurvatus halobius TaxID=2182432 RepID=UPI001E4D9AED|nr:hypothetical protein [Spiribacter halobius]UEX77426.1 hypothetical protein LMH63_16025 [Spiribacter halobius]
MPLKWLPWKWLLRRAARSHGFLDPLALMARLRRFGQPSEVAEPIELLRAGMVFHARGLINTRVIQHNLDWVWPYWIEQQFDPHSEAFLPRAFSITHVNLTHRNWTAVGRPDCTELPIVDPRGLVTPWYDGWSLDGWVLPDDGEPLYPSRTSDSQQWLETDDGVAVVSRSSRDGIELQQRARVVSEGNGSELVIDYRASAPHPAMLAVALRPYNPEGIAFIHRLRRTGDVWEVDGHRAVRFEETPEAHYASDYEHGDVAIHLHEPDGAGGEDCETGLVTGAALFRISAGGERRLRVRVPLPGPEAEPLPADAAGSWGEALAGTAALEVPDAGYRFLYDAAMRTLVLHSVADVYPGPYTYKRFWFRDAAFIIHALLAAGLTTPARRALLRFPERQTRATGYFHSQEGEWDSNGQALWIAARFTELTGEALDETWLRAIRRGAHWVARKRTDSDTSAPHAGLLPAGFSAEHLGPNDYYYWDDFWAEGGLRTAADVMEAAGRGEDARWMRAEADDLQRCLRRALENDERRLGRAAMPASPYRRLDAGAVGSLAVGYPLQRTAADDPRLLGTVEYLLERCRVHGGFFQDMIHSGVNAYLTLHMAQVLMRAGDDRCFELMDAVARLASPTGQWPEAIHPRTGGGCMGDGQHVWAAAEWVLIMRNAFLREEGEQLVLAGGVPPRWLASGEPMAFGPAPTPFGSVRVTLTPSAGGGTTVAWEAEWRRPPEAVVVAPAGRTPVTAGPEAGSVTLPGSEH